MKTEKHGTSRICPGCGRTYTEQPALSRVDNETEICSDCGIREALKSIGISEAEREHILKVIHGQKHTNN